MLFIQSCNKRCLYTVRKNEITNKGEKVAYIDFSAIENPLRLQKIEFNSNEDMIPIGELTLLVMPRASDFKKTY